MIVPAVLYCTDIHRPGDFEIGDPSGSRAGNAARRREPEVGLRNESHFSSAHPPPKTPFPCPSFSPIPIPSTLPFHRPCPRQNCAHISPSASLYSSSLRTLRPPPNIDFVQGPFSRPSIPFYLIIFPHRLSWHSPRRTRPTPGGRQRGQ